MATFGGMEDYRKMEANPLTIGNYTIGLERYGVAGDSNIDDKARADRLRADFLARNARGNEEHSKTRHEALSRALLSSAQVRAKESLVCGMTPEARRQLWFTLLLIAVSLNHTIMSSIEQRFVGHLGKDSMAARSISFSVIMYFYGISSMWAAISAKIGRAVGAKDYPAIGKYIKMAIRLGIVSGAFAMALIYPFGPYVMKHLYLEGKPHVLSLAVTYLYIHTVGMSLDYLCGVGSGVVQGMQQLSYYCFLGFFESIYQGFSNWVAINVLGWGIAGSAAAHVSRKLCMFVLIYGYLYRLFSKEAREESKNEMWSAKVQWSDWAIFSKHSFYLLFSGYMGVADQQVNTLLIAKMGTVDMAGNSLIGTMMSYPFIFSTAFGTVISTLGSRYIGERDDRSYLRLGLLMIVISGIIGASLGGVVVFFADDLLSFFTQEQDVIDVIKPVFPIVVPYIAAGMVRSVMYGMAWAMQEFGYIALFEGISTCVYIPMCLYAKYGTCPSCVVSLKTLMEISLVAGLVRTVFIAWLCLYMIPKRLRALKAAEETLGSEKAREMMVAHFGA